MKPDFNSFFAHKYFDLQSFEHKNLFVNNTPCWNAFDCLENYFQQFSFKINSPMQGDFLENKNQIYIGRGCKIGPFVHIEGPCIIGNDCEIRPGAFIRKGTIIGNHCVIGHGSEICRSIVLNHSKFPHLNYVGDSIIGNRVNLGAGSKCANYRLDKQEIAIVYNNKKIFTGRKKFGAIIGDRVSIGCNAVLNPGTVLCPESSVEPCKVVKGVIKN